ncbi:MAG: aminopeptidase [Candidatus Magnetoglobus multicellularis str. Araruama]|uniref:Aminopeptidase n=1 Tax=Candidatus Magnetoglobus multicellularis str. Araruama TaxID=890399 RepID=A0A1V1PAF7_9BACT|nr:MAG: aminopeptidase [Candidatus Magnetoglobus multicellularis str. Araruama]
MRFNMINQMITTQPQLFSQEALERFSEILLWGVEVARQNAFKPNDNILIQGHLPALSLIKIVQKSILTRGLNPIVRLTPPADMEYDFYECANEHQLTFIAPGEETLMYNIQGAVYIRAPESLTHLENIDAEKQNIVTRSRDAIKKIMRKRQQEKLSSWVLTSYPTPERARHANLDIHTYAKKVIKACYLDHPQALSIWQDTYDQIVDTKRWLLSLNIDQLHIESNQIDLRLSLGDCRKWLGLSGRNIPSFEIFTSPDWRTVNGTYYSDQQAYIAGNAVKDIRLTFNNGQIVKATAETGENFLVKRIKTDAGAARVGEFSMTDRRFSQIDSYMADVLYDENYGGEFGNCHIALGRAFDEAYNGDMPHLSMEQKRTWD